MSGEPQLYEIASIPHRASWSVVQLRNLAPLKHEKLRTIVSENLLSTVRDFEAQELKKMRDKSDNPSVINQVAFI